MLPNTVFYQLLAPSPLVKADGSVDLRVVGNFPTLETASQVVSQHGMTQFVILTCVAVVSTLQPVQNVDNVIDVNPANVRQN